MVSKTCWRQISNDTHGHRRVAPILPLAAAGAAAIAATAELVRSQGWCRALPQQAPPSQFNSLPAIQWEAERLCRDPGLIAGTLSQRTQQFSQLHIVPSHRHQLLAMADQDPMITLIAWSQQRRCQEVSSRVDGFLKEGRLGYITTGRMNGQPVMCTDASMSGACDCLLYTLKSGQDAATTLKNLLEIRGKARGPLYETNSRL